MLFVIIVSATIAGGVVAFFVMLGLAFVRIDAPLIGDLLTWLAQTYGVPMVMFATGLVVFVICFFFFSQPTIRYIEQISGSLQRIAYGDFEQRIPVRSRDELGRLAGHVNSMTRQLKESIEEERKANRAKEALITSVSHDLRTPLTSIMGYLTLIEEERYHDEAELRQYAGIALAKARRLQRLIDDLFEYTRVSFGGMKLNRSPVDLGQLLEQLIEEQVPLLHEAGMEYRLDPPEERITISADGNQLARVFENLVTNAIRYGREGRFVDIRWWRERGATVVQVINYGRPIPPAELPHIFDRFYRVEKSRSDATGGTGLGLAIAKSIVELHGGRITARSDDRHTLFEIHLPILRDS